MKKGYTAVWAAEKVRVGRCHGSRYFRRPTVPSWRLWLACGHVGGRTCKKPPRSVKCDRCAWDWQYSKTISRDWLKGELPDGLGVIRFDKETKRRKVTRNEQDW